MDYLTAWRLGIAMGLLKRGQAVGQVAEAVGYGSASALARVFSSRVGASPLAWLKAQNGPVRPDAESYAAARAREPETAVG